MLQDSRWAAFAFTAWADAGKAVPVNIVAAIVKKIPIIATNLFIFCSS